jgi:hypothetical protein
MGTTQPPVSFDMHPALVRLDSDIDITRKLEHAVMELEDAVYAVLESNKGHSFHDVDFLYWDRTLKNIATPISLALSEYKGPRRFHYHYRHDPNEHNRMMPVFESPLLMLVRVCRDAMMRCNEMVGVSEKRISRLKSRLELALKLVISSYNSSSG